MMYEEGDLVKITKGVYKKYKVGRFVRFAGQYSARVIVNGDEKTIRLSSFVKDKAVAKKEANMKEKKDFKMREPKDTSERIQILKERVTTVLLLKKLLNEVEDDLVEEIVSLRL